KSKTHWRRSDSGWTHSARQSVTSVFRRLHVGRCAHRPYLVQGGRKRVESGRLENQAVVLSARQFEVRLGALLGDRITTFLHEPVGFDPGVSTLVMVRKTTPDGDFCPSDHHASWAKHNDMPPSGCCKISPPA